MITRLYHKILSNSTIIGEISGLRARRNDLDSNFIVGEVKHAPAGLTARLWTRCACRKVDDHNVPPDKSPFVFIVSSLYCR